MQVYRNIYSHVLLPPKRKKRANFLCCRDFKAGVSGLPGPKSPVPGFSPAFAKVMCGSGLSPEVPRIVHGVSGPRTPESPPYLHRARQDASVVRLWTPVRRYPGGGPEFPGWPESPTCQDRSLRPQDFPLPLPKCGTALDSHRRFPGLSTESPEDRSLRPICIEPVKTQVWCATGLLSGDSPEDARSFLKGRRLRPLDPGISGLAW